ncbi:MAG: uracil-DNA glycosylase [Haloarculaceae archaeon]
MNANEGSVGPADDDVEGSLTEADTPADVDPATLCVAACERCPDLVASRSRIVNGLGPADADLLFVGEGPGAQEDAEGEPFVGRSGDLLDEQLLAAGLEREQVRITNCVRCRPPDNRDPTREELDNCRGYLEREIAAVDPALVVTLGKVPAEHLLERDVAVTGEAGDLVEVEVTDDSWPLLISVHPAAVLYDRNQEGAFEDAIATAADYADDEGGQSRLGQF